MKRITFILLLLALPLTSMAQRKIVISKQRFELYVIEVQDTIFKCPVGVGKNYGNKQKKGDNKTPEGAYKVSMIQNSTSWTHDFHDGHGQRRGAFGPWFIRLKTPGFGGIGIHGTCFPESIGTRCSEGCIRLYNEDVSKLKRLVKVGMTCEIEAD